MAFRNKSYDPNQSEPIQWNMAQQFCFDLAEIMKDIKEAMKLKDWPSVYQLVEEIYTRISYLIFKDINKTEIINGIPTPVIKRIFEKDYKTINETITDKLKKTYNLMYGKNVEQNLGIIRENLQIIRQNLYWFMWDLNLIFPEEFKADFEKELKEGYE